MIHMKKYFLIVQLTFATAHFLSAQEIISTQGDTYSNANSMVTFTIGEVSIETVANGSSVLTQGFNQTYFKTALVTEKELDFNVVLFPNPAQDYCVISTSTPVEMHYLLYDEVGKKVKDGNMNSMKTVVRTENFKSGTYLLILVDENQNVLHSTKLIIANTG